MTASGNLQTWPDSDTAARAWLARLKSGEATQRDLDSFAHWRAEHEDNARSFEQAVRLWDNLGAALAGGGVTATPRPRVSRRLFLGGSAGLAVVAAVMVTGGVATPAGATRFETGKGERKRFRLEQQVSVELNSASRLYYWPDAANPRVNLAQGEALIAAACGEGRQLIARADDIEIAARNARFLLKAEDGVIRIACLDGTLEVRSNDGTRTLSGDSRIEIRDGTVQPAAAAPAHEAETAWRNNVLVFRDRPADEVIAELNRHRPGRIVLLAGKGDVRISGVFHLERADLAVDHLARSLGMKVTRLPGGVAILRS